MRRLERLRAILAEERQGRETAPPGSVAGLRPPAPGSTDTTVARLAHDLGATRDPGPAGAVSVIRRTFAADRVYGRRTLGRYAAVSTRELDNVTLTHSGLSPKLT